MLVATTIWLFNRSGTAAAHLLKQEIQGAAAVLQLQMRVPKSECCFPAGVAHAGACARKDGGSTCICCRQSGKENDYGSWMAESIHCKQLNYYQFSPSVVRTLIAGKT
jgi:hypothetical protein